MKETLTLKLERPARKGGGDRYEAEELEGFMVYVPQKFSRRDGVPKAFLTLTFEDKED